ncbi:MAG: hypothetical protein E7269_05260 [Lachnospiraceae bacterium]|nr:hypothetical protein [Lachnospiraceae bacterium]
MDIKEMIDKVVKKVKSDDDFKDKLFKDPVGTLEDLLGVDIPEDKVDDIVNAVKEKVLKDKAGDLLGGAASKLGGLFKK